jgi:hypothetical protein
MYEIVSVTDRNGEDHSSMTTAAQNDSATGYASVCT